MRWVGILGLAVVAAVLVLLVWQPNSGGTGGGPLNPIAEAAEKTQAEPGGRGAIRGLISSPKLSEPLQMTGRTVFDSDERSRTTLTLPDPKSGGSIRMVMIAETDALYFRSNKFGSLPKGAKWMGLDLTKLSSEQESEAPVPTEMNAQGELQLLATASGDVQKVGKEDVRGVKTTRYRLDEDEDNTDLQIEAWIDADKRVRRMRILHLPSADEGGDAATIDMRIEFFDFGIEPKIEAPDSSEVFDATDMATSSE